MFTVCDLVEFEKEVFKVEWDNLELPLLEVLPLTSSSRIFAADRVMLFVVEGV